MINSSKQIYLFGVGASAFIGCVSVDVSRGDGDGGISIGVVVGDCVGTNVGGICVVVVAVVVVEVPVTPVDDLLQITLQRKSLLS